MFAITLTRKTLSLAIALLTVVSVGPARAEFLRGQVNVDQNLPGKSGPSLNRNSIKHDPFGAGITPPQEIFDAPSGAFDAQHQAMMPPPPPTFGLGIADEGSDFAGQPGMPVQSAYPKAMSNAAPQNMLPALNAQDPEMSGQMRLQWDAWHRSVAEEIFRRFDSYASKAFANSRPISCDASYTVTCTGQIRDVRLLRKSDNFAYNAMLIAVINSMNGNPLLAFPPGSHRQAVHKSGTFSRNCGVNGFKHTINDNESVKHPMMQRGY